MTSTDREDRKGELCRLGRPHTECSMMSTKTRSPTQKEITKHERSFEQGAIKIITYYILFLLYSVSAIGN